LSKGYSSMELARKIASKGRGLFSKEGLVITIGKKSVSARSVAQNGVQVK
jgi:hypothetical protein